MAKSPHFDIGFTATYIQDFPQFSHVVAIPAEAAIAWVKMVCPDTVMGLRTKAIDLTIGSEDDTNAKRNGWLNKLFIVVGFEHTHAVAINNHDGEFSVYKSS